ncbi:hypothetical protein [Kitasatospora sp. MBT63]|uniref:hypothetical protein n=1 Tax=Kitasatospora sp. MBT63 TaxID=1444768 RepID=UPI0013145AF8|nr:hypothetical protein [Kitasatospora sp. MBT63]
MFEEEAPTCMGGNGTQVTNSVSGTVKVAGLLIQAGSPTSLVIDNRGCDGRRLCFSVT